MWQRIRKYIKGNNFFYQSAKIFLHLISFPFDAYKIVKQDSASFSILGKMNTIKLIIYKITSLIVYDSLRHKIVKEKHRIISNFLDSNYEIISQENVPPIKRNPYRERIWVCWLQGEAMAPELVKVCLRQIRAHANGHEVILIDKDNFHKYVDVPEIIFQKYISGVMLPAHFSDYIRYQLLYRYGGAWLDATLFVTQKIGRDQEFCYELYSAHYRIPQDDNCIAHSRWVTPLFFCKAGNGFMYNTYKIFEKYHLKYNHCIDYLLIDYIMDYAVRADINYADMVNSIPINNDDFQKIYRLYALPYNKEIFDKLFLGSTYFYKLTYKNVPSYYKKGQLTVYGYLMLNY